MGIAYRLPADLSRMQGLQMLQGWGGLSCGISNKCPGNADVAGLQTTIKMGFTPGVPYFGCTLESNGECCKISMLGTHSTGIKTEALSRGLGIS